jgi:predicted DNA-binding transcriptional regulator AlpA
MVMPRNLQDQFAYPPRGMRADRAAAYLDMSKTTFLDLVKEGVMPKPVRRGRIVRWDRLDLDAAFDDMKEVGRAALGNTIDRKLGLINSSERDQGF